MMKYLSFILLFVLVVINCNAYNQPADKLISRVTQGSVKNVKVEISPQNNGKDFFSIRKRGKIVVIKANNTISAATGFNWYLKYVAGKHIAWNNLTQKMPESLPLPDSVITKSTYQTTRYYLNYCTGSYSMAFWDWSRWEKELDWMAMHGINRVLSIVGNGSVWYNVLKKLGYTTSEINQFIAGPAYQAWWLMNNLEGWGGPNTANWYKQQELLEKKILARMHELGIQPVLPGYSGMVPDNIGKKLGYKVDDPGRWNSFKRPGFLSPTDPNFKKIADLYYHEMTKLYGKANFYSMDPFHEGGNTKGVDLDLAGKSIMAAMKRANPKAVWVIQAWQANPRPAMIDNLKQHDLLVLDLYSEKLPQWGDKVSGWYRPKGFGKHDWLYCMLLNFGGRVGLHGRMDRVINSFYYAKGDKNGKHLTGVGATPEAIENNPMMFELLFELPWRQKKFTKEQWIKQYVKARYGQSDENTLKAWQILANTSYNCPNDYPGEGTTESYFCARPAISPGRVSCCGSLKMYYNPDSTRIVAGLMLKDADKLRGNNNYEYDLADIMRQALADKANVLTAEIANAYKNKDIDKFKSTTSQFLELIKLQDELLSTRAEFSVGLWIASARKMGATLEEKKWLEWNARTLITVWGNREASELGGLHDYSSREWSGLLRDLYLKRWTDFFDKEVKRLEGSKDKEVLKNTDYYLMDENWTRDTNHYESSAVGNTCDVAKRVYEKVFQAK